MGEQSPSESNNGLSTIKAEVLARAKSNKGNKRKLLLNRQSRILGKKRWLLSLENEDDAKDVYARSQSGSIIRSSSSGRGVTSSYGRGVVNEYRQAYRGTHSAFGKSSDKGSSIPANQSNDDAYAPQAERPKEPIIDPIQTAGLSLLQRKIFLVRTEIARARRFIRTI